MLMTKYSFLNELKGTILYTTVTRKTDGAQKIFSKAGVYDEGTIESMDRFMNSITDDLADGYFPKERKDKNAKK